MTKQISLLSALTVGVLTVACSSTVALRGQLSPELVAAIKPDIDTTAVIEVVSDLPETFEYENDRGFTFQFPLNQATAQKMRDYVQEKYPTADAKKKLQIHVKVVDADVAYDFTQSDGEAISGFLTGETSGQASAKASVKLLVSAKGAKNLKPFEVVGRGSSQSDMHYGKYTRSGSVESVYAAAMDEAIDRAVVNIDRRLSTFRAAAVSDPQEFM